MTLNPLEEAIARTERVAVVGSPSSTASMQVDILGTAAEKQLVGAFVFFKYIQEGRQHCGLGQISEVSLRNAWAEDATMKGLIRLKGQVDPVTGRQDVHTAKLSIGAIFSQEGPNFVQGMLGTVPSTGTPLHLVDDEFLSKLLAPYQNELVYLGRTYGSRTLLPMWFRHFGKESGGIGEAYHLGIFGKTGSGKSVLSKMVLLSYARHKSLSIIVIDPQGEFSKDVRSKGCLDIEFTKLGRSCESYGVGDIVLPGDEGLFKKILISSKFLQKLGIYSEMNLERAADAIVGELMLVARGEVGGGQVLRWQSISKAYENNRFDAIWLAFTDANFLGRIYTGTDYQARVLQARQSADEDEFRGLWTKVARLFSNTGRGSYIIIPTMVKDITGNDEGKIIVVDLSKESVPDYLFWNEDIQMEVLNRLFVDLTDAAEKQYRTGKLCNTLVLLDEAHRFAPRSVVTTEGEDNPLIPLRQTLVDSVKTTRKYGLGWMFISQTMSGLDQEILNQLRIYLIGFGLGWGNEYRSLRELIGGNDEAIRLYQSFRDPQSSIGERSFPFMIMGPSSPLSFSGSPLFINALKFTDEFESMNSRIFRRT